VRRVLILGGDGYLGWPTAMHLSSNNYEVAVVDNYLRRNLMRDEDVEPLYGVPNLDRRTKIWNDVSHNLIKCFVGDLNEWDFISRVFMDFEPDTIVHYAEQPSAPYSMARREAAMLTIKNNINVTSNVIFAICEFCPNAHLIKLGTMGEYGTPNIDIEEGWIDIKHNGRSDKFLYPRQAGSLYHTTKIMDTDLLWFYTRVWGLRVTDLMQGPVYGIFTNENRPYDNLLPYFSYDELFGTVLNRFILQSVIGHPLTVYGQGGQTRGYINIIDTMNCVRLSIENPAKSGELKIYNQFTETFSVNQLAEIVVSAANDIGLSVEVKNIDNPRVELEDHYYNPAHTGLFKLGLSPTFLTKDIVVEIMEFALNIKEKINKEKIMLGLKWN